MGVTIAVSLTKSNAKHEIVLSKIMVNRNEIVDKVGFRKHDGTLSEVNDTLLFNLGRVYGGVYGKRLLL